MSDYAPHREDGHGLNHIYAGDLTPVCDRKLDEVLEGQRREKLQNVRDTRSEGENNTAKHQNYYEDAIGDRQNSFSPQGSR